MAIAAASRSLVAFAVARPGAQVYGPPAYTMMRRASGGLRTKKSIDRVGGVLRRGTVAVVQTGQDVAGTYGFELSAGWADDLIAAALCGQWNDDAITDGSVESDITFSEVAAAGSAYVHRTFYGCRVINLEFDFVARQPARCVLDVIGSREEVGTVWATPFSPASRAAATQIMTTPTMTFIDVLGLLSPPPIRRISLALRHDVAQGHGVTSIYGQSRGLGAAAVSGSIEAYFSSPDLYQAMLDHATGALTFTIGAAGQRYLFSIPKAQLGDGSMVLGGKDDDLIASIPFEAKAMNAGDPLITIRRNAT